MFPKQSFVGAVANGWVGWKAVVVFWWDVRQLCDGRGHSYGSADLAVRDDTLNAFTDSVTCVARKTLKPWIEAEISRLQGVFGCDRARAPMQTMAME